MNHREDYVGLALYIDGRFVPASERQYREPVFDPATGKVLGQLPHATTQDLDDALAGAENAFTGWSGTSPFDRANILHAAADHIRERLDWIARIMSLEQGKPLAEARVETQHAADLFDWYAEEGRRAYGRVVPARSSALQHLVTVEPVGPCAAFTPWNFPALTPARKLGGALAAGCTVILKASEETPGTAVELVRALHDAGLPAGCAQLVFGDPATVSSKLIAAPSIRKVSFTGSTAVGIHLMKLAAEGVKRTTMELGGNAPVIVFEDADYDRALEMLWTAKLRNAGQVCVSPARFIVHESLYDRFSRDVVARFASASIGNGLDPGTMMGPLANPRRVEAMEQFLADADRSGARTLTGGSRLGDDGNFFLPAVVTELPEEARLLRDECFGPIMPIVPFRGDDEAYRIANGVEAGLAAYAFTTSLTRAREASRLLQAGMVGINSLAISQPETPFGGVKASGYGAEGGTEGLAAYQNTKLVTLG